MGKASSSKKVARAARAGGRNRVRSSQGRVFPMAVAIVVALGVAVIAYAKFNLSNRAEASPPTRDDHWHIAFGIYVCDKFLPAFTNTNDLVEGSIPWGIHTHGDGIIHIHPFTSAATGDNADLGAFFRAINVDLSDDTLTVPSDTEPAVVAAMPGGQNTLKNGAQCGDKEGRWEAAYWANAADAQPAARYDNSFDDIKLRDDRGALTLAFVPEGTDIPKPESIPTLDQLTDVAPTATTIPGYTANPEQAPASTVPGETTVPGATVPGETTVPGATPTETTVPGAADTTPPAAPDTVAPTGDNTPPATG